MLIIEWAGKDATEVYYANHRQEILSKYAKLKIGSIANEKQMIEQQAPGLLSTVPYGESAAFAGLYSPYYNDTHRAFRTAVRTFIETEILPEAAEFDELGKTASKEVYKKMGAFGLLACRMGPGPHLKAFTLPGGVKYEEFDYFHEQIAHEECARLGYASYQDALGAGMVIGLPCVMHFAKKELKEKIMRDVLTGEKRICLAITEP